MPMSYYFCAKTVSVEAKHIFSNLSLIPNRLMISSLKLLAFIGFQSLAFISISAAIFFIKRNILRQGESQIILVRTQILLALFEIVEMRLGL